MQSAKPIISPLPKHVLFSRLATTASALRKPEFPGISKKIVSALWAKTFLAKAFSKGYLPLQALAEHHLLEPP